MLRIYGILSDIKTLRYRWPTVGFNDFRNPLLLAVPSYLCSLAIHTNGTKTSRAGILTWISRHYKEIRGQLWLDLTRAERKVRQVLQGVWMIALGSCRRVSYNELVHQKPFIKNPRCMVSIDDRFCSQHPPCWGSLVQRFQNFTLQRLS